MAALRVGSSGVLTALLVPLVTLGTVGLLESWRWGFVLLALAVVLGAAVWQLLPAHWLRLWGGGVLTAPIVPLVLFGVLGLSMEEVWWWGFVLLALAVVLGVAVWKLLAQAARWPNRVVSVLILGFLAGAAIPFLVVAMGLALDPN